MRNWTKLYFQYGRHGGHVWNRIQKLNATFGVLIGGNICTKFHIYMSSGFGEDFYEDVYGRRTTNDERQTSRPWQKTTGPSVQVS